MADAAARPVHGPAHRAEGWAQTTAITRRPAAVRTAGHGQDAAGQGHRQHMPLHLLQHQRLVPHQQVGTARGGVRV